MHTKAYILGGKEGWNGLLLFYIYIYTKHYLMVHQCGNTDQEHFPWWLTQTTTIGLNVRKWLIWCLTAGFKTTSLWLSASPRVSVAKSLTHWQVRPYLWSPPNPTQPSPLTAIAKVTTGRRLKSFRANHNRCKATLELLSVGNAVKVPTGVS